MKMSFEAAVGRIDQILQLQQQLLDPASLVAGSSATSTTSSSATATGSGASTDFASMLASAQGTSATTAATATTPVTGAGGDAPAQVQAMTDEANSLLGKPYVYGGGHSGW